MFLSILHRSILIELVKTFTLSLAGITSILVMAGIVAEASQQGLNPLQILGAIPLLVPNTLPYTIPTTTLFAVCLVYGRLAHDNEILAIKAAGINVLQAVWPGMLLGLAASLATLALYVHWIPHTHYLLRTRVLNDVEEYLYAILAQNGRINQPDLNYSMWVQRVQGKRLEKALFKRRDAKGNYDIIASAEEASLHVDMEKRLLVVQMRHGHVFSNEENKGHVYFENKEWVEELPKNVFRYELRPRAMNWTQLLEERSKKKAEMDVQDVKIAEAKAQASRPNAPPTLPQRLKDLKSQLRRQQIELNCLNAELHMRPAISFGCLFFVLVGCPVGIWFSRSDYLSAFITCFLPIVVLYYPIQLCCTNFAKDGTLSPAVAMWAANGALALTTPFLFRYLLKH